MNSYDNPYQNVSMAENASLNECIDQIASEAAEREATPRVVMKLGIQIHFAVLPIINTVSILEIFGGEQARSTVHSWVHKAELHLDDGRTPDHVAVDEIMI